MPTDSILCLRIAIFVHECLAVDVLHCFGGDEDRNLIYRPFSLTFPCFFFVGLLLLETLHF